MRHRWPSAQQVLPSEGSPPSLPRGSSHKGLRSDLNRRSVFHRRSAASRAFANHRSVNSLPFGVVATAAALRRRFAANGSA